MLSFAPLQTRAGDLFAAELRQTAALLLTHAANPQIAALLAAEDGVFASQAFPPPATPAAPGWANLRELLSEDALSSGAPQAAEFAPWKTLAHLAPAAAAGPAGHPPEGARWSPSV